MEWIDVRKELPPLKENKWGRKESDLVLANWRTSDPDCEPGGMEVSFYDGRNWQGANGEMDYHGSRNVTHWMPLPDPPEE